jgi:cytochrome c553
MNTVKTACLCGAAALMTSTLAAAQQHTEGGKTYAVFNCGQCHGEDARTPKKQGVPKIAGLDSRYIAEKTDKLIETMSHKDAIAGCAEPPTRAQIQAIAEWVSRQPN